MTMLSYLCRKVGHADWGIFKHIHLWAFSWRISGGYKMHSKCEADHLIGWGPGLNIKGKRTSV